MRLILATSAHDGFVLTLSPLIFTASVSILASAEMQKIDDDDPAVEEEPTSEEESEETEEETLSVETDQ